MSQVLPDSTEVEAIELEAFEEAKREIAAMYMGIHDETASSSREHQAWLDEGNMQFKDCLDDDNPDSDNLILCPICKDTYNHAGKPICSIGDSGNVDVIIPFSGECGHHWYLNVIAHKGQSFASVS